MYIFPLTYFTIGGYQALIAPILGNNFNNWLIDAGANSVVNNPHIIKYLLFLKMPLLFMDILIAFLLLNYFKKREDGEKAFTLWLFNPFTIILIYAFSNIDIYAVLLTVIAFLYIKREKLLTWIFSPTWAITSFIKSSTVLDSSLIYGCFSNS